MDKELLESTYISIYIERYSFRRLITVKTKPVKAQHFQMWLSNPESRAHLLKKKIILLVEAFKIKTNQINNPHDRDLTYENAQQK